MPDEPMLPALGGFSGATHLFPLRVYFEDTDLSGIVYHANYLRYMERARSEMLRAAGIEHKALLADGQGYYAVADVAVRYLLPARIDDLLVVRSRIMSVRAAACVIGQNVTRGRETLTRGQVTAVFLSPEGRPKRQADAWRRRFSELLVEADKEEDWGGD